MTEDQCHNEAERLFAEVAATTNVEERRRLINEAMRWRDRAMIAHDHDLEVPRRGDGQNG